MDRKEQEFKLKMTILQMVGFDMSINGSGVGDFDKIFSLAKGIYYTAMEERFLEWDFNELETPRAETKPIIQETKEKKIIESGFKACPKCGEMIPESWKKHVYKKDGFVCGYKFEKLK